MSSRHGGRILLALTSHGLGHLTRSLAIARELRRADPALELVVATEVAPERVARDLPGGFEYRAVRYEPGILQRSCFETDVEGTRRAYRHLHGEREENLARQRRFLEESRCDAVMSDVPALPVRAAADLGLPAVGVSNFTWDWILEPLLDGRDREIVGQLASDYGRGRRQLRLPFGPETSPFPESEPAPLVSRRAALSASRTRLTLGLPEREDAPLVLVCPGGWDPDGWEKIEVRGCAGLRLLTVGDLPISGGMPVHSLPHDLPEGISFPDLVQAADVVLAKPGYGIASECAAHRTPLVVIERPGFRETPVLVEAFGRLGPCVGLSLRDFFAGLWESALGGVLARDAKWGEIPEDGARRVAERILAIFDL